MAATVPIDSGSHLICMTGASNANTPIVENFIGIVGWS
ncbi:hypothetical protein N836_33425 [Leptolyngbya sp. Heron Island J]|nr:hypothetical protein N836_33425 [Leptolyngbya sp. Heron Island J]